MVSMSKLFFFYLVCIDNHKLNSAINPARLGGDEENKELKDLH